MDAVVTIKATTGELDTLRLALKALAEVSKAEAEALPVGKLKTDVRATEAQARSLAAKLG